MTIPIQHLTFHCRWTTEARLPDYLGSTLRGAFGWALKKSSCALRRQECATCILRSQCAYAWIFETDRYIDAAGHNVNARPHPYIFRPEQGALGTRQPGEHWQFSLLLIGRGNEFLPYIVYSAQLMGEEGIGVGIKNGLGRFVLEAITAGDTTVFDESNAILNNSGQPSLLQLAKPPEQSVEALRVTLHTPLRLKQDNILQQTLPFHSLMRATLRRISALEAAYGGGEPPLNYAGIVQRAEQVETTASTIRWRELMRFSNRQRKKVSLSGIVGTVDYRGNMAEFLPLLDYASQAHLGKQTVFGLGNFSFQPL